MNWDFTLILFGLLLASLFVSLLEWSVLRPRRLQRAQAHMAAFDAQHTGQLGLGTLQVDLMRQQELEQVHKVPAWIEFCLSFFPVILIVFVVRSFVAEPFRIPSGSMLPTLQSGDLILVNKFQYGIRLPILDKKIIEMGQVQRGDVVVFRYPVEPALDYIKRVVGLPGDEVLYQNQQLFVNGEQVASQRVGEYFEPDRGAFVAQYAEQLGSKAHNILQNRRASQGFMPITNYPHRDQCSYLENGVRCTVPAGHYFMMGDNRDNSLDSRYWGFVPDGNIVGRAFFIWMNFSAPSRIGRVH